MIRVLVTAFKPYDRWTANSSWLAMVELTKALPENIDLTTRLYPADYEQVRVQLAKDLADDFDFALHLGQAPGACRVALEAIGLNVGVANGSAAPFSLERSGPAAYRSELPLWQWADKLRLAGIPAEVSYHAGTQLCNATIYLCHHLIATKRLQTKATFLHVPLDVSQVAPPDVQMPSLPAAVSAAAIHRLLQEMAGAVDSRPEP